MRYSLKITHVDTCLSCFVLDHCNGDNEALFGVYVDSSSRMYSVKERLMEEILNMGDKIPDEISNYQVAAAIAECFAGVHPFKAFDSSLERASGEDCGEACQAWFRLDWEAEES